MLSAYDLDCFDRCERRYAFERDWAPMIISPTSLLYQSFEGSLSSSTPPDDHAKSLALKIAGKMDLKTTALEPYAVATHIGSLAGILATFIRAKLGILMPAPVSTSPDGYEWKPGTFEDSSGLRHRFVLVDHWDDDRLTSEAHSWLTIGELAASGRPLTLHALVIGASRQGRRHSPWTKGFLHPANRQLRFGRRRKGGKQSGLSGEWVETWRESYPQCSTQEWLRVMQEDQVLKDLVVSRPIKLDSTDIRLLAAQKEIVVLQSEMANAKTDAPMRRSSCDEVGRGACPFQPICYSPYEITPADLPHLYQARNTAGK